MSSPKPGEWVRQNVRKRASQHPEVQADGTPLQVPAAIAAEQPLEQQPRVGGEFVAPVVVAEPDPYSRNAEQVRASLERGLREFHESSRVAPLEGQEPIPPAATAAPAGATKRGE